MLSFRVRIGLAPHVCGGALGVLRSLLGPVRAEPGCIATRLLKDVDDDCELTWVEEWRSVEDFQLHLGDVAFRRIVAVIETASSRPIVEIDEIASRRGFELVEEILSSRDSTRT